MLKVLWAVMAAMLLCLSAGAGAAAEASEPEQAQASLLSNGRFEQANASGDWPKDWPRESGVTWEREGETRFLRLRQSEPGKHLVVYRSLVLPQPLPSAIEVRLRLRYTDIVAGDENWHLGRILLHFKNEAGEVLHPDPDTRWYRGSSDGWVEGSYRLKVPEGSHLLEVMPCLFHAKSGTLDVARCEVFVATEPKPQVAAPAPLDPASLPPELRVEGNRIVDANGDEVWLQGINSPSLSWSVEGDHLIESVEAILDWNANLVRLPLNQAAWFGRAKGQSDEGASYRALVDRVVRMCAARKAYVVLDLHWSNTGSWDVSPNQFNMPDAISEAFWKDVATLYANHPAVLFDLYNEPKDVSWNVWRNGGDVVEGKDGRFRYRTLGMQGMLDLIRSTGARNIVVVAGLDWGYDLSGALEGYAIDDPTGNGVVYASHIYEWKKNWRHCVVAIAEKHPVLLGEVGADPRHMTVHKEHGPEEAATWVPDMLGLIQAHKLHWAAWSMHTDATPRIVSDWRFTPTPFWGTHVKDALSGKPFELKRMR